MEDFVKIPEIWDVGPSVIIYPSTPRKVAEESTLHTGVLISP